MSWTLLGLRFERSYSQTATKLQSANKPELEGLGYPWQHCSPPGRFPAAFKVFIVDSWLVTECDWWKDSSTAPSSPSQTQQVGAAPSLANPAGLLHTPHLNWEKPIAVITLLLSPGFLYASCPSLWRALRWTSADALLGSSYCHQKGWYPATRAPCFLHHPAACHKWSHWKMLFSRILAGSDFEKKTKVSCVAVAVLQLCFFFHSCSLLVFIKKDPCIINIVHPSTVTIKQTPYFHTTHDLQGYR